MRFQLLLRCFVCAMTLVASAQATKVEISECNFESKDPSVIKIHKPCKSNGDKLSFEFEVLKEISGDETMLIESKLNGEQVYKNEEKMEAIEKKFPDYNDNCELNFNNPISTGMRGTDSCKVDGSSFNGMENKDFEISIDSNIWTVNVKGRILDDN